MSALALAPSVSFADTTENNVVTASVSEGTIFESWLNGGKSGMERVEDRIDSEIALTLLAESA